MENKTLLPWTKWQNREILAKNVKNSNYHDLENFVKSYNDIIPQRCSEKHLGLHSPKNYSISFRNHRRNWYKYKYLIN